LAQEKLKEEEPGKIKTVLDSTGSGDIVQDPVSY
jgi:hypothetical protein